MEWPIVKLGDITEVITKGTTPTSVGFKFIPEGVNFVKVESITSEGRFLPHKFAAISEECNESLKRSQLKEGDVLFSIAGALGRTALVTPDILPANTNQALAIIRLKAGLVIDKHFLLLALTTRVTLDQVEKSKGGVAQQNLSLGQLKGFEIPLPPIPEQKRIVAILDQVFADIEQARAKTEQNLKNARELFESYLQQVFSKRGEGWEERKWGDVCQFVRGPFGGSLKKSMFKEEGFAVYEQKHAIHDHIEQIRYFIDDQKFEEMRRFEVKPGELIMSCSGVTLGRVSVIPEGAPEGIINQALLKLAPNEDINIHFLKYWVRSKIFQDIIFEHSGGAAIPNVPAAKILKEITLLIPSLERQSATVNEIDSVLAETNKVSNIYKRKIESLDELKKSILQKAFSGELTKTLEGGDNKGAVA